MKTLINKANPEFRITAPEIGTGTHGYYYVGNVGYHKDKWTLVEEEPVDLEKKYIDAEKLKAEIKERLHCNGSFDECGDTAWDYDQGMIAAYNYVLSFIDSLQQEQPEMDLEKFAEKIKTFQGRYKHPEIVSIKGAMAFMARMFYQYPDVARQWYEQLPKATMD